MTVKPATLIANLLRASSDDETVLQFALPDSAFGFHAQQAVEKLYKVLLATRKGSFPYSHDLQSLRKRVEATGIVLPVCSFRLEELSEYAGEARYAEPIALDEPTRIELRRCIADLCTFVRKQLED